MPVALPDGFARLSLLTRLCADAIDSHALHYMPTSLRSLGSLDPWYDFPQLPSAWNVLSRFSALTELSFNPMGVITGGILFNRMNQKQLDAIVLHLPHLCSLRVRLAHHVESLFSLARLSGLTTLSIWGYTPYSEKQFDNWLSCLARCDSLRKLGFPHATMAHYRFADLFAALNIALTELDLSHSNVSSWALSGLVRFASSLTKLDVRRGSQPPLVFPPHLRLAMPKLQVLT
jgi:hypothetical protein